MLDEIILEATTDTNGDATVVSTRAVFGKLYAVEWVDGSFANGVDPTLTAIRTPTGVNQTLLTLSNANDDAWYYPRTQVHDLTGAVLTYDSTEAVSDPPLINGVLQLVVANGGNTQTGSMIVYVESC
jgi:hypothetical protein